MRTRYIYRTENSTNGVSIVTPPHSQYTDAIHSLFIYIKWACVLTFNLLFEHWQLLMCMLLQFNILKCQLHH